LEVQHVKPVVCYHLSRGAAGFEAQHAVAFRLMRLVGDASKTDAGGTIADKITAPPDVQAVATKVASGGGRGREYVIKVHKKRSRSNKRKRSK
jgi:hypothetical protein